jgi:hypothetical protein
MNFPEALSLIQIALSACVIPLIKILWDIKIELAPLAKAIEGLDKRVERVERWQDGTGNHARMR